MAKIIHSGDIHLDSAFVNLTPENARLRRRHLRDVFSRLIDTANDEQVDALILAGDVFDAYPIFPETEAAFLNALKRAEMPVFITPGNHDPYTADSPYRTLELPENVYVFKSEKLSFFELDEKKLRIFGFGYNKESFDEHILDGFTVPDDDFVNILILHSNLYTDGYSPVTADEIKESFADYVALGHVHKPTEVLKSGKTHYAYCGCLVARDFGEMYDTGYLIGEVTKSGANLIRRSISDIKYREITVDIGIESDISKQLPSPSDSEHIRLTLVGECEKPDVDAIFNEFSKKYGEFYVEDKTTAPRDLWLGIEEDTLRGVFLRKMKAQLECATDEEKEKILLATKFGINAIENRDI